MEKKYDLNSENVTIFRQLIKQKELADLIFCSDLKDPELFDELFHEYNKIDLALCITLLAHLITE